RSRRRVMAEEEKTEDEVETVDESELVPDPGPPSTTPQPAAPSEEELEARRQEQAEAEDAAREQAEGQPEDASVEAKARNEVLVLKQQFEAEWPTVKNQFPGVEPEFGKEEGGYVELKNVQAPAMAFATHCEAPVEILAKPARPQHGWDDFVDNALPPSDDAEEGDIEAKPKGRSKQKVSTK
ncbi:MAG TPA: hypothetical protein VKD72_10045, partial [Gemmataceae bacterium]|nr:hypothetical protein [Gemmataceae bacterium]